ncbi:MAG: DUF5803 family protein [Methanothrix sp.]|nr:DUF5803 family protein [Methanothrix sp.]
MCDHLYKSGLLALLFLVAAGLISTGAEWNGTSYHLGEDEVQVILPVNASHINLTLFLKAENMTLFDEQGRNVTFNSSYQFRRGDHLYSLVFERPVRGKLVYSMSHKGQQFILPISDFGPVSIILPKGYTTGERSLGIARPQPDQFIDDASGDVLIWNNTTTIPYIEVNYYRRSAPVAMMIIIGILAAAGIVLLVQYYISIKKLKAAREEIDNEVPR